ncbi:MAG: biosynthetic peptidoglycan transglycosylase [Gemmatimonadota bacterium]
MSASPAGRFIRRLGKAILVLILLPVAWLFAVWPPPSWYRTHWPAETAFMELRTGRERPSGLSPSRPPVRQYHPVPLDSIAKSAFKAVTTGEDDNFWVHNGIDYQALRHALGYKRDSFTWSSSKDRQAFLPLLARAWSKREALRGASTITQQLAKNLYLSPSRNPMRKVKEAVTAYRLEWALSKERILELYLNVVELGDEVWGFDAGSRRYFKKPAVRLSQEQAAALAATLPFPLSSNPAYRPGRMRWRQQLILRRMRGEKVEVPRVEAEPMPVLPDTTMFIPPLDTSPASADSISPPESPNDTLP